MATSQNGWSASPNLPIRPLIVDGESFSPGVRDNDNVYTVLRYVAEQVNARVEPIVRDDWHQADDWGFYYRPNANDPNSLSNHSSGTAIDYNATRHPNGVSTSRSFTAKQTAEVHKILAEADGVVRWGGDYTGTPDAMHFEINAGAEAVARVARELNKPEPSVLRLVTFNVYVGQSRKRLRRNLRKLIKRTHRPHVIALQEAGRFVGEMVGYQTVVAEVPDRPEAGSCVLLIRDDIAILRERPVIVNGPRWFYAPRKKWHEPRVFIGASILVDGQRWDVLCVHRTPGGPESINPNSWLAEDRTLEAWARHRKAAHPGRPVVILGDQNGHANDPHPLGLRAFADRIYGGLVMAGIDGAITRNCAATLRKLHRHFGSDHRPVVITATKENA